MTVIPRRARQTDPTTGRQPGRLWSQDILHTAAEPGGSDRLEIAGNFCILGTRHESNCIMEMVESPTVETVCLPFSNIPNTSRLFDDFLHHFDKVQAFYSRPPVSRSWWEEEKGRVVYPEERRSAVAGILERQNREFGAGQRTFQNLQRFREGAQVIVTGQQVGLFGGPLFCLLKAVSAVQLAEEAGAVPVFWLASEDHDFEEISFTHFPVADHLEKLTVTVSHKESAQVGAIAFDDEIAATVKQV